MSWKAGIEMLIEIERLIKNLDGLKYHDVQTHLFYNCLLRTPICNIWRRASVKIPLDIVMHFFNPVIIAFSKYSIKTGFQCIEKMILELIGD